MCRGNALDLPPVFQIVGRRLPILRYEVHHRRREDLADDVGDVGAAAGTRGHETASLQRLQRIAHDRPRHVELARQLALAGQPVADADHALEDEHLYLSGDVVVVARDGGVGVVTRG